jgi:hypothetical protein
LTKGACGSEKGQDEAECVDKCAKRACTGDFWFASVATAVALKKELYVDFVALSAR